jgi:hypothetical protein
MGFEAWWSEVHSLGISNTKPLNPELPDAKLLDAESPKSRKRSFKAKYLELAMTENFLPADSLLTKLWVPAPKICTLANIRTDLQKVGFVIRREAEGWRIVQRPPTRPTYMPSHKTRNAEPMGSQPVIAPEQLTLVDVPTVASDPIATIAPPLAPEARMLELLEQSASNLNLLVELMRLISEQQKELLRIWQPT